MEANKSKVFNNMAPMALCNLYLYIGDIRGWTIVASNLFKLMSIMGSRDNGHKKKEYSGNCKVWIEFFAAGSYI